jgi:uncharacterized protein YceK
MKPVALIVAAIGLLMLPGCGTAVGVTARIDGIVDSVYQPTAAEVGLVSVVYDSEYGVSRWWLVPLIADIPVTATTDTILLPWDVGSMVYHSVTCARP